MQFYCTNVGKRPVLDNRGHQWECYELIVIGYLRPTPELGMEPTKSGLYCIQDKWVPLYVVIPSPFSSKANQVPSSV